VKTMHVGSTAGLRAAQRGECDIAGIHLLDPATDEYNRAFITSDLQLVPGYRRMQCLVYRPGDARFAGRRVEEVLRTALADPECVLINRNTGSGTRILLDRLLQGLMVDGLWQIDDAVGGTTFAQGRSSPNSGVEPGNATLDRIQAIPGYGVQAKSHTAVAAAIAQGRADWGLCIDTVARMYGLEYIPVRDEHYDFVIPRERLERPAVHAFRELLDQAETTARLAAMGFRR